MDFYTVKPNISWHVTVLPITVTETQWFPQTIQIRRFNDASICPNCQFSTGLAEALGKARKQQAELSYKTLH